MTRLILIVATLLLAGCNAGKQEEAAEEAELTPIGPGSDSSALMPRDTPESRGQNSQQRPVAPSKDSL